MRSFNVDFFVLLIAAAGSANLAAGCASTASGKKPETLQAKNDELLATSREQRMRIHDLEQQLALARAETAVMDSSDIAETLPVEVRQPEVMDDLRDAPRDYEVMGVNDDGVEIVYVGEATRDDSFKVTLRADRRDIDSSRRSASRRVNASLRDPLPTATDSLPVTSGPVPTIDSQLKQAASVGNKIGQKRSEDSVAEYKRYYQALRSGNHAFAVTGFKNFIARYPNHDYADNAQYWLGEAHYDRKEYDRALHEFQKVVIDHSNGNKVADALLKMGFTQIALKDIQSAESSLEDVIRRFPRSNAARLAREKLDQIASKEQ